MAENGETVPGFTIQTQHFIVKFIAGFEKGLPSKLIEYETDWLEVMTIILETLEIFPTSVEAVEEVLAKALDDWIILNAVNDNIRTSIKIEEKVSFPPPLGFQKVLKIFFSDKFQTEVHFHFKKKFTMKSLRELGAYAAVENMEDAMDIAKLDIPRTLFPDLVKAFRDDFSKKYHKANINCCFHHTDGIIGLSQLCNLSKRRYKGDENKQQQSKKRKVEQKSKTKVTCPGCGKSFVKIASHKCKAVVPT